MYDKKFFLHFIILVFQLCTETILLSQNGNLHQTNYLEIISTVDKLKWISKMKQAVRLIKIIVARTSAPVFG